MPAFTVEGIGPFPSDMLRYDACYPATQKDVTLMDRANRPQSRERTRVTLVSVHGSSPTVERWKSFGWEVVK